MDLASKHGPFHGADDRRRARICRRQATGRCLQPASALMMSRALRLLCDHLILTKDALGQLSYIGKISLHIILADHSNVMLPGGDV